MTANFGLVLIALRSARELRWRPFTMFNSGSGADGQLYGSNGSSLPLDIYTADERSGMCAAIGAPLSEGIGVVFAEPSTVEEAQAALSEWCRVNLGRVDLEFDEWELGDVPRV